MAKYIKQIDYIKQALGFDVFYMEIFHNLKNIYADDQPRKVQICIEHIGLVCEIICTGKMSRVIGYDPYNNKSIYYAIARVEQSIKNPKTDTLMASLIEQLVVIHSSRIYSAEAVGMQLTSIAKILR